VLEKSITENRKHSIRAKISAQIVDYYKIALTNSEKSELQNNVGSKKAKEWKQYCTFKLNYYIGLSNYYSALSSAEINKYGEAIGYVQVAESKLSECVKMKYSKEFQETLKYAVDCVDIK
jgi:tyrosine-protein phosphatase non-receptor type 23